MNDKYIYAKTQLNNQQICLSDLRLITIYQMLLLYHIFYIFNNENHAYLHLHVISYFYLFSSGKYGILFDRLHKYL